MVGKTAHLPTPPVHPQHRQAQMSTTDQAAKVAGVKATTKAVAFFAHFGPCRACVTPGMLCADGESLYAAAKKVGCMNLWHNRRDSVLYFCPDCGDEWKVEPCLS